MTTAHHQPYLARALADGHAEIVGEGRNERIHYIAAGHSERWTDPEEKVRAELWAELVYKYEYDPELIGFEVNVPRRTPNDYADLVIFSDDALKMPYFVFECKRADLSDAAFNQSIEQACGNRASLGALYCGAVAGSTRRLLRFDKYPPGERERNHLADIPVRYGNPPEWRFYKNVTGQDLAAVSREELRAAIRKCHQTLWEGGRRSPIAAFGEFSKLVFIKHLDEKDLDRQQGEPYDFQRRDGETADQLAARVNALYDKEQQEKPDVFTDRIAVDPPILAQCVEHLEGISLDRTELDTKGVAFEEFMGSFFKGDFGQYFTPRELIAFCVAVLDPKRTDLVMDPACGSGGFLLYALDHVRRKADELHPPDSRAHFEYWHNFAQNNLYGLEINEELARVAKMNMIIHDDGHTNVVGHDALDFPGEHHGKNAGLATGRFDLVLTNPPFGATIRRTEKGDGYLEQFELMRYLGKNYPNPKAKRASIKTEIAFLERIHSFLKPGTGKAAVVLPDGILTNSSLQGVRHWLLNHFQLLAVVSLPQFAFSHYDAGVKASIVFLRRLADGETVSDDDAIFMALTENIGYDATGRKTFEVELEEEIAGVSKVERHRCDLFDYRVTFEWVARENDWSERRREIIPGTGLLGQWEQFNKGPADNYTNTAIIKSASFRVQRSQIEERLNADYYHPERIQALHTLATRFPKSDLAILNDLVHFVRDQIASPGANYLSLAHIQSHTGELTDTADIASGTCFVYQTDDVLFARLRPYLNKVYHAKMNGSCSTEFHVLRVKDHKTLLPEYLAAVLRSRIVLAQTVHMMTGNTHPRLANDDVANLTVYIPDMETQKNIAAEIYFHMENARRLRAAAAAEAETAKQYLDQQITIVGHGQNDIISSA